MPMSQYDSMTQEALHRLSENLEEMPRNMRQFSSVFRELYTDQAVGGQSEAAVKFRKLRDDTRQDAIVYLKCVLPVTTNFITCVKEYFEYYEALSYNDLCEMLPDILVETRTHKDLAQTVLDIHQDIMVPLKTRQDRARVVMTEFVNLQSVYHSSEGSPRGNMALAIAAEKQYEINKNAARTVADILIPALARFIDGLQKVARFFQVIENELESFENSPGDMDERKQSHYIVMRNSARDVKSLCVSFYAVLPDVRTDFEALPSQDTDQNYVDKWLEKMFDITSQTALKALLAKSSVIEQELVNVGQSNQAPTSENIKVSATIMHDPKNNPITKSKNKAPPSTNGSASTPVDDSVPTSNDRPASTPVDIRVPKSEDKQANSPKIKQATTSEDDPTTLISKNKRATSKEDLIERNQQRCQWRCTIM